MNKTKFERAAERKIGKIRGLFLHKGREYVLRDYEVRQAVIIKTDKGEIVITDESELDEFKKIM